MAVAYKPFYNQLARAGFATFMQQMLARLLEQLRLQTLMPEGNRAVARFTDIVIQDGSSFAIKPTLAATFPGRFTTIEPAAVDVHATYRGFADDVSHVALAPDAQAERAFLPDPATLRDRLLLADRGYRAYSPDGAGTSWTSTSSSCGALGSSDLASSRCRGVNPPGPDSVPTSPARRSPPT